MNLPGESGEEQFIGPEPQIIEELLTRIFAAPADASIQDIATEVVGTQPEAPIDLLALHNELRRPEVTNRLRDMLWKVIEINLSLYSTQMQAAEVLDHGILVPRDAKYADREETPLDCLYRNMYAVRDGKTVSDVFRQVVRETQISHDEVMELFLRPDVLPALTTSLIVAAREKFDSLYRRQFTTGANKKRLVEFARGSGGENLGYSAKLLTAYGIPFGESLALASGNNRRNADAETKNLAGMIAADRDVLTRNLLQDIIQWLEHAGPHVSMHEIVAHFAQEGFVHDGLGVDEISRLFKSPVVESILEERVTQMARQILNVDYEELETYSTENKNRIDPVTQDAVVHGKMRVSDLLAKYLHHTNVVECLPSRATFTKLLIKSAQNKVKHTYRSLLLNEYRRDLSADMPTIDNLGSRMAQSIASGQVADTVVHAAVDDITRAGIELNDACDIVSLALTKIGHRYSPEEVQECTYKVHGEQMQAEAARHATFLPPENRATSFSKQHQYTPSPDTPDGM